jgi:hypothetical protein
MSSVIAGNQLRFILPEGHSTAIYGEVLELTAEHVSKFVTNLVCS